MLNIFYKLFLLSLLLAFVVPIAKAHDVVKVQRRVTPKQNEVIDVTKKQPQQPKTQQPQLQHQRPIAQPLPKQIPQKQKERNLEQIKQLCLKRAKYQLNNPDSWEDYCDFQYKILELGASNVLVTFYNNAKAQSIDNRTHWKIHGNGINPKQCVELKFDYESKAYNTIWCK